MTYRDKPVLPVQEEKPSVKQLPWSSWGPKWNQVQLSPQNSPKASPRTMLRVEQLAGC